MTETVVAEALPDQDALAEIVSGWLVAFETAAGSGDLDALEPLFVEDCWWRDLLSITWDLTTARGMSQIRDKYGDRLADVGFRSVSTAAEPPIKLEDGQLTVFLDFETAVARGRGVVRLVERDGHWRAWTLLTVMQELIGHEEHRTSIHDAAKESYNHAVNKRETWTQMRDRQREFVDSEPAVLIVGAGHAGLNTAARLAHLGVPALVVEQTPRIGDIWRNRYNNLLLHDPKWYGQMPYLPFPDNWPVFAPKEMIADWLEAYSWILQLNVWTGTRVDSAEFDDAARQWTVQVTRDGAKRDLRPRHIVFATGAFSGEPEIPQLPGVEEFRGRTAHSSAYDGGGDIAGRKIVVVGTGASAHDVAQDAYEMGAEVTMVQRGPTYVISSQYGVPATHEALYSENSPPVDQADLLSLSLPWKLYLEMSPPNTQKIAEIDKDLLNGLRDAGFRLTDGIDGTGLLGLGLGRGGGFYIDKGCSSLIADRKIALQHGEIASFTTDGVVYSDGTEAAADIVVFATGWPNMRDTIRPIVGDDVADNLSTVWGFDDEGELKGMFRPTGHPRLWFMAGGFQQSRYGSKLLGLQIKAIEEGVH